VQTWYQGGLTNRQIYVTQPYTARTGLVRIGSTFSAADVDSTHLESCIPAYKVRTLAPAHTVTATVVLRFITVVLICITPVRQLAITVGTVILWALDRVRGRALGWLGPGSPKSQLLLPKGTLKFLHGMNTNPPTLVSPRYKYDPPALVPPSLCSNPRGGSPIVCTTSDARVTRFLAIDLASVSERL